MKNIFIFVVCGAREHIDTLHFSLPYLQKFSSNEIWVLTDSSRNEVPVIHDHIIDIKTPEHFDNHQASIYLKTGVYQFVPKGNKYCYLDTDIIAFSKEVDLIFDAYVSPITFAPDHCNLPVFSASAVHCSCLKELDAARNQFENKLNEIDPLRLSKNQEIQFYRKKLQTHYLEVKKNPVKFIVTAARYVFSPSIFKLTNEIQFDKKKRVWKTTAGMEFMADLKIKKVTKDLGLKWNYLKKEPQLKDGRSIWRDQCPHLKELIFEKFQVAVKNPNFQHWNGGVFLFDDNSHAFLSNWFNYTLEIFKDSAWKTRDQGTLIATVWKFGLENHPTLAKKWNLIADYHNPYLNWTSDHKIQLSSNELIQPNFIHVYHHFQDEEWGFWNQLITHVSQK